MTNFESTLLIAFILFLSLDLLIIPFAVRKNLVVENRYYAFHKKYGVKRTSILKIILGVFLITGLADPGPNVGRAYFIIVLYFAYLVRLFILILYALPEKPNEENYSLGNPLDSLAGFLVYPFEYLDTNKQFHADQPKDMKWSWGAFLVPEYWYFNNEILGAGYISWAFLIFYLGISLAIGSKVLIAIVSIRILSGAFGQKLFYARYGKWA